MGIIPGFLTGGGVGPRGGWDPSKPTSDGGALPHTWHYAESGELYQDAAKTTPATADGDPVGASVNQGSDTHDIAQANAANKMSLRLNVINGKPVFRLDGTDWLQGAFNAAPGQPLVAFAVTKLGTGLANDDASYYLCSGDDATNRVIIYKNGASNPDKWYLYAGNNLAGSGVAGEGDTDWHIFVSIVNGVSSELIKDGTSLVSGNAGAQNPDGLTLGAERTGASGWNGDIADYLIYSSGLSNADINQVSQYLATRYALSWADLP
jgi:hypothetical protein